MHPVASYTEPHGRFVDIHFEGGLRLRVIVLPERDRTVETWWSRPEQTNAWQKFVVRSAGLS